MDELLVMRARAGNRRALVKLIMKRKEEFYRLSYSYMKNEDDAMNMLQDLVIRLYEKLDRLKNPASFYSYSKTILVNLCKDELARREKLILLEDLEELGDQAGHYEDENSLLVEEILAGLDERQRQVIHLKYILGYDNASIARILDIPLGTVKSRAYYGLLKLKEDCNAREIR